MRVSICDLGGPDPLIRRYLQARRIEIHLGGTC
jgi:hypothetical protein